jgi:hypothetical protein
MLCAVGTARGAAVPNRTQNPSAEFPQRQIVKTVLEYSSIHLWCVLDILPVSQCLLASTSQSASSSLCSFPFVFPVFCGSWLRKVQMPLWNPCACMFLAVELTTTSARELDAEAAGVRQGQKGVRGVPTIDKLSVPPRYPTCSVLLGRHKGRPCNPPLRFLNVHFETLYVNIYLFSFMVRA